jgi:hypothetical protein
LPTVTVYANPQPNPPLPSQESGSAQSPSGLSCGPANAVPSGPPSLLLASAAAVLAGAAALAARRRTVEPEPTQ